MNNLYNILHNNRHFTYYPTERDDCMSEAEKLSLPVKSDKFVSSSQQVKNVSPNNMSPAAVIQRVKRNPESFTPADAKVLQSTIGNQGVSKLIKGVGLIISKPVQNKILQGRFTYLSEELSIMLDSHYQLLERDEKNIMAKQEDEQAPNK